MNFKLFIFLFSTVYLNSQTISENNRFLINHLRTNDLLNSSSSELSFFKRPINVNNRNFETLRNFNLDDYFKTLEKKK